MIYINIQLWPGGHQNQAIKLAEIKIANVSNLEDISSYKALILAHSWYDNKFMRKEVIIKNFPRKERTVIDLLYRVLKKAVGGRND